MTIRRKQDQETTAVSIETLPRTAFPATMKGLWEHMCLKADPETGNARITSTLTVFTEDGMIKAFVNSRDTQEFACVSAQSFQDLFLAIEKALADPNTVWRRSNAPGGRRK